MLSAQNGHFFRSVDRVFEDLITKKTMIAAGTTKPLKRIKLK